MTQSNESSLNQKVEAIWNFSSGLLQSLVPVRAIGYGLLFLAVIDVITLLIPPQFLNPVWEFQTIGGIVERAAVPLIGFALIFLGERSKRGRIELPILKFLSWLSLLLAILFILMIPLGVFNTIRIEKQSSNQIDTQVEQQLTQIQTVQEQLAQAQSQGQMEQLLSSLDSQGRNLELQNTEQMTQIKEELSGFLSRTEQTTKIQAERTRKNRRITLAKNSFKWNLGALISGVLFFIIWRSTAWARKRI